ncbi:gp31.1 conserved hypothetical protein [Yersinia phage phiR1-RT]|uniref:Uncharacterized protein n=2 Tax=Tegunavirus TaxID=1921704 RepID=A0A1V0DXY6_9CAUD|nr:gp31.1 conserved hypothetical protein [Yersinia phage phiR1-RT]YP_010089811.1 hypothetical protein KNT60_gp231 [Yersinia phage fHe-Yen9-01]ARB06005.1 hypothetical protein fHeYen901_232 [Yersinia phage fHe-Yen9-01]CCI88787.1 gp31.1 conserved hypothetical protein [Yersinia phage phiR1-RT]
MSLSVEQKIAIRELSKTILADGISEVVFEKKDGSIRVMKSTRDKTVISGLVGESVYESYINPEKPRAESVDMIPVFDVEAKAWRGFSLDKLISINSTKIETLRELANV